MSRRWSRWLGMLALIALLALATVLSSLSETGIGRADSARSNAPDGRRAARLLLAELGFETHVWRRRPAELPRTQSLFVLADVPHAVDADPDDPLARARRAGPHSPGYYRRFVDEGGVLAVPPTDAALDWLSSELELEAFADVRLGPPARESSEDERGVTTTERTVGGVTLLGATAEHFDVELPRRAIELPDASFEPLLEGGGVLAARRPVGHGEVVLLPPNEFLQNESLRDYGHLWVRLVESLSRDGRVYFDEYALGDVERESALSLSVSPALRLFTLHALALTLFATWRGAWPRPFPRRRVPTADVEPLARVRAHAAWYRRGRRIDLLARELRRSACNALAARYGSRAGRALEGTDEPSAADVRAWAERAGAADAERWIEWLVRRSIRTERELERLERELAGLAETNNGETS